MIKTDSKRKDACEQRKKQSHNSQQLKCQVFWDGLSCVWRRMILIPAVVKRKGMTLGSSEHTHKIKRNVMFSGSV